MVIRRNEPPATLLPRAAIYIASVIFLMIATGGISSGLGALLLMPVVGIALYGRRWESTVVVALVVVAVFCVSQATPTSPPPPPGGCFSLPPSPSCSLSPSTSCVTG